MGFLNLKDAQNALGYMMSRRELVENDFRTCATLPYRAWEEMDAVVVPVAKDILVAWGDVDSMGLVAELSNPGILVSMYQRIIDMTPATFSMSGKLSGPGSRGSAAFDWVGVPVPVGMKEFDISWREMEAAMNAGGEFSLDTTGVELATRRVAELLETALLNGVADITLNGQTIKGYTNHGDRNTVSGSDWGTDTNIEPNVRSAVSALEGDGYPGPYVLYVANTQYGQMRAHTGTDTDLTYIERIKRGIPEIADIKRCPSLAAGTAVLVALRRDVVDIARALDIGAREWNPNPSLYAYAVWCVQIPRVKSDSSGASGVCHISGI